MPKPKGYRLVRGHGAALRVIEQMSTLSSDQEARDWYWRRWGNDDRVRIQKRDGDAWVTVPRAVAAPAGKV
jgi:hypothetical protein